MIMIMIMAGALADVPDSGVVELDPQSAVGAGGAALPSAGGAVDLVSFVVMDGQVSADPATVTPVSACFASGRGVMARADPPSCVC